MEVLKINKYKIFYWINIGSVPKIITDDIFTNEDHSTNYIKITFDESMNNKVCRLFVKNKNCDKSIVYSDTIKGGQVEFQIENIDLSSNKFIMNISIKDKDKIITSPNMEYSVDLIEKIKEVHLPKNETERIEDILEKISDTISNSHISNSILQESISQANSKSNEIYEICKIQNNKLLETSSTEIEKMHNAGTSNLDKITIQNNLATNNMEKIKECSMTALERYEELDSLNSESSSILESLKNENKELDIKISLLNNVKSDSEESLGNLNSKINESKNFSDNMDKKISEFNKSIHNTINLTKSQLINQSKSISKIGAKYILDRNSGLYLDEWHGKKSEFDSCIKYNNRKYYIYSDIGELTNQCLYKFKSPNEYFDNRISIYLSTDEDGLVFHSEDINLANIKTLDNKKIEECLVEDNEDFQLYCDGGIKEIIGYDGLYEKYLDAIKTIKKEESFRNNNKNVEILNNLEFHMYLIDILNKEHSYNIDVEYNQKTFLKNTLEEIPKKPEPFKQNIFISICFGLYVDKKNNYIYIGNGMEDIEKLNYSTKIKSFIPDCKLKFELNSVDISDTIILKGVDSVYNITDDNDIDLGNNNRLEQFLFYRGNLTKDEIEREKLKNIKFR